MKLKNLLKLMAVLAILLVATVAFSGCGKDDKDGKADNSNSMTSPIDYAVKGLNDADVKTYIKALPSLVTKYDIDDDLMESMEKGLKTYKESRVETYGDDVKITYEVKEKEKMDEDDLNELVEYLKDKYENASKEELDFTEGYELEIEFTIKGSKDSDTRTKSVNVYKISGKWYTDDMIVY